MNRDQAVDWCIKNKADFINGTFPPPNDWMWVESGDSKNLYLTAIFTSENYPDIRQEDLK